MSERVEREDMATHDVEIEVVQIDSSLPELHRASCSCGFNGPLRMFKREARGDGERHQYRRAAGEA